MQASKATLDAVHRNYTRALAPLTINSRPLIKDLTLLAEKNIHAAPAVVHAICSRLKSGHRKECLPTLYLIDSICKNVGRDYLRYFSESIPGAFIIAYRRINPNDQHQFRRVLEIWKSSPGGPIFHPRAIATIDKELGLGTGSAAPTQHRAPPAQRPDHDHSHAHYGPQHQPPLPPPPAQPHHYHQPQATPPLPTTQTAFTGANANPLALLNALTSGLTASMAPAQPAVGTGLDSASLLQSLLASNLLGNMPLLTSLAPPAAAGVPPALAATMSATPFMPALSTGPTSPFPTITPLAPPPSTVIEFTNEDLQQKRTGLAEPLYGALALHCHQCGARYPDTPKGRKQLSNHLDWHFRRNRRLKEKLRQAQPRGWLVSEEDWIESRQSSNEEVTSAAIFDQVGNGGTTNGNGLAHGDGADGYDNNNHGGEVGLGEGLGGGGSDNDDDSEENGEGAGADETALRAMTVGVPAGPHSSTCPVCGEKLNGEWSEDDEDWVYHNAVLVDSTIYHATCRTDMLRKEREAAVAAAAASATITTGGVPSSSQPGTPAQYAEAGGDGLVVTPSGGSGVKRKLAEDEGDRSPTIKAESDTQPDAKRLAVEPTVQ